jgi:hypothetical protein
MVLVALRAAGVTGGGWVSGGWFPGGWVSAHIGKDRGGGGGCGAWGGRCEELVSVKVVVDGERGIDGRHV